jgi:hypothetical protein
VAGPGQSSGRRTSTRSGGSTRRWTRGTRRSLSIASSPAPELVVGLRAFDVSTDCVEDPYIIRFIIEKNLRPLLPCRHPRSRDREAVKGRALSPDVHRKWWSWTRRSSGRRTLTRSGGSTRRWTRGTRRSLSIASSPAPKLVVGLRAFDVSTDCIEDPYIIRFIIVKKIFVLPNMPLDNAYNLTWPTRPRHSPVPATSHSPCQPQTRAMDPASRQPGLHTSSFVPKWQGRKGRHSSSSFLICSTARVSSIGRRQRERLEIRAVQFISRRAVRDSGSGTRRPQSPLPTNEPRTERRFQSPLPTNLESSAVLNLFHLSRHARTRRKTEQN